MICCQVDVADKFIAILENQVNLLCACFALFLKKYSEGCMALFVLLLLL